MTKSFVNVMLFLPLFVFGYFDGSFTRKSSAVELVEQSSQLYKLDSKSVAVVQNYGPTIQKYSTKYGLDWRLVIAVMKMESRFSHNAESEKGASGLMQIMPVTQLQIADELGIDTTTFENPHVNIRGGIYYLAKIYKSLDGQNLTEENHIRLTLAAYNAGLGRVFDAQRMAMYCNDNPKEWTSVKNSFSLLSRKYSALHKNVWEEGRPSSGYFSDWQQTSNYVENIMGYYKEYRRYLSAKV